MPAGQDAGENVSRAARFFRRHPDLRARAEASHGFQRWREKYRGLDLDGERMYVRRGLPMSGGGDTLLDADELILEWAQGQEALGAGEQDSEATEIRRLFQTEADGA